MLPAKAVLPAILLVLIAPATAQCTGTHAPTSAIFTDCEYDSHTGQMDATYAASLVPDNVGEPLIDVGPVADASLNIFHCAGAHSPDNKYTIGAFTLVTYDINVVPNAALNASSFTNKFSPVMYTDNADLASWLNLKGMRASVVTFTSDFQPYNGVFYPASSLSAADLNGVHFTYNRAAGAPNENTLSVGLRMYADAATPTWMEAQMSLTAGSQVTTAALRSNDAFWFNDPTFGHGNPEAFLMNMWHVQEFTLTAHKA